ncbi:hypothetical protein CO151_03820 [bacterium CG_4_9_14_3_um_filter_65_15]|nr:MAG: hypothetical protein CO151_03820 [bacterium CG_4_9_14_3_um_filter_65_15]
MLIAVLTGLALLAGCNSSTDPGPGGMVFSFSPQAATIDLDVGGQQEFSVIPEDAGSFSVDWKLDGMVVSQSATYLFKTTVPGQYGLHANITYANDTAFRQWNIAVTSSQVISPPVIADVTLSDVPDEPGAVKAAWTGVKSATYPIVEYVVGADTGGSLNASNWDQAEVMVIVPATTQFSYSKALGAQEGVAPGQRHWVAVRARDDHGNLSPLRGSVSFPVSFPWYVSGRVRNDFGIALGNTIMRFETSLETLPGHAAGDGTFGAGPFSSKDSVQVSALALDAQFYKWQSPYLKAGGGEKPLDIVMIPKYGADATCSPNGGDFLAHLRYMTRTGDYSDTGILHKWNHYPVRIFIPDFLRGDGVDFTALCADALQFWNDTVGEDLLVRVDQAGDADVEVDFRATGAALNGQVVQVEPGVVLGTLSPLKMRMDINMDMVGVGDVQTEPAVKGVCLHEFGHVLGLYDHSTCDDYALMENGGGPSAFSPETPAPITEEEINAVRCLSYMPDGVDMDGYDFESSAR